MKQKIIVAVVAALVGVFAGVIIGWAVWAPMPTWMSGLKCLDGTTPDVHGCCAGEVYTDMGPLGFNCCPDGDGDCFPPITK